MIIEIKDIPQGKKIKHLSVDIDFTDSESTSVNSFEDDFEPIKTVQKKVSKTSKVSQVSQFINPVNPVSESKQESKKDLLPDVNISDREEKEIPQEMTNAEF